ncbi:MAG: FliA/WhiG family RNA polymerase sigma factor [Planctomycetota bacterium]|jgi:RNA polymerase sigma factor for flagellar operon FliA|nr:FliA/WhiG family RNA polymerase sigma factor [Planctomycetota bacterium]
MAEIDLDEQNKELWEKYRRGDRAAYEALVESYLPMVKITVGRLSMNVPGFIDRDELYSAGCFGLLAAVEKFDPNREAKFTTYALTRIRGAVIDDLRRNDMLGRVTRDRVNKINAAEVKLNNDGSALTDESIAEAAGLTMDEYWDAETGRQATRVVSFNARADDGGEDGGGAEAGFLELLALKRRDDSPGRNLEMAEIVEMIFGMLDEKEKLLMVLYYNEELTLREIGRVMKVSESRVSQLHTAMIAKIKRNMKRQGIYM